MSNRNSPSGDPYSAIRNPIVDSVGYSLSQSQVNVQLDWVQYFKDFCEAHGKHYVVYNNLLLFHDGWRYSLASHMGPEFPPPIPLVEYLSILTQIKKGENPEITRPVREMNTLLRAYWGRRRMIVRQDQFRLFSIIESLEKLQAGKSVPLSHTTTYRDEEGKYIHRAEKLDLTILKKKLEWLTSDIESATDMLQLYVLK